MKLVRSADNIPTEIGKLAASMKPGDVKQLATKNCNRDLFKMWYDWEEEGLLDARLRGIDKVVAQGNGFLRR
jgi:hypothetical protein